VLELWRKFMIELADIGPFIKSYAWAIILLFLVVEILCVIAINRARYSEVVPQESRVGEMSENFRSHSLTFAGMAFTVIALLVALAEDPGEFVEVLEVLAVTIVLMFFVYEVDEVTETRRFWFMLQEKALGYGFMSLFIAVILLYFEAIPEASGWLLVGGFVVVAIIRFFTVRKQLYILKRRKEKGQEDNTEEQSSRKEREGVVTENQGPEQ